jgi:hypothetical protein
MKEYLVFTAIGITVGLGLSVILATTLFPRDLTWFCYMLLAFCTFSCGYLATLPVLLMDLFKSKGTWKDSQLRAIAIPLVGASIGCFLLCWRASINFIGAFDTVYTIAKLFGDRPVPDAILRLVDNLISQLCVLRFLSCFLEDVVQTTALFAFAAMVCFWVYDALQVRFGKTLDPNKTRRLTSVSITALMFPVPVLIYWTGDVTSFDRFEYVVQSLTALFIMDALSSGLSAAFVWNVRELATATRNREMG